MQEYQQLYFIFVIKRETCLSCSLYVCIRGCLQFSALRLDWAHSTLMLFQPRPESYTELLLGLWQEHYLNI